VRVHSIVLAVCTLAFIAGSAPRPVGQAANTPPANPAGRAGGAPPSAKPAAPDNYTYDAHGRRDPFVNVLGTGVEPPLLSKRGEGAAGWTVAEISVRGIVQTRGTLVAMVRGPDNRTLLVHPGDKFLDGTIKAITPQGLIIVQEVNDPLSLVKQREIRKQLRTLEDSKQ
jgi:hypothetical protein